MAAPDRLVRFVGEALASGRGREEIARALDAAGWRERDIARAMALYADTEFLPPVPRPQPFVSARDAFVYGLGFVALVICVVNLVSASFELIDWAVGRDQSLRLEWDIAPLLVFAPLFWWLDRRARAEGGEGPMRKFFSYGALFCACLVLLGALVTVLALLLGGGLDLEVALKALVVAVVALIVLGYYRGDLTRDADRG